MAIDINKQKYFEILKDIVKIPSPSGDEAELAKHLIDKYEGSDWIGAKDQIHNVYFKRKDDLETEKLPLLLAHIDTVEHPANCRDDFREILRNDADFLRIDKNGGIKKKVEYANDVHAGFDDKAGVAAILYLMKYSNLNFRVLLTVQEEATSQDLREHNREGGGGIKYILRSNREDTFGHIFDATSFVIALDRKNGNDIINFYGDDDRRERLQLCTDNFLQSLQEISNSVNHLMEEHEGSVADVYNIKHLHRIINCVNLSIGYANDHRGNDTLEVESTIGVMKVVTECLK